MTFTVSMVVKVLILISCILTIPLCREFMKLLKYRKREKQLKQLKRIGQYFATYQINPIEAEKMRGKDIKIEHEWLYTDYFFFNMKKDNIFNKMQAYYVELMQFFIAHKNMNDKTIYKEILEVGNVLNALA